MNAIIAPPSVLALVEKFRNDAENHRLGWGRNDMIAREIDKCADQLTAALAQCQPEQSASLVVDDAMVERAMIGQWEGAMPPANAYADLFRVVKLGLVAALDGAKAQQGEAGQTAAARDVLAERRRQVEKEGWTPEHDDEHIQPGDSFAFPSDRMTPLAAAAACYLTAYPTEEGYTKFSHLTRWPWGLPSYKPECGRRGQLIKAGALILAEIERLDRAAPQPGEGSAP